MWEDVDLSAAAPLPGYAPPPPETGFFENFWASFDADQQVNSAYSLQYDLYDAIAENQRKTANRLGGSFAGLPAGVTEGSASFDADELSVIASQFTDADLTPFYMTDSWKANTLKKLEDYNASILELKKEYPNLETVDEMFNRIKGERQAYAQKNQDVGASANLLGTVGSFAGSIGASGDFFRNPLVFGSLFVGGVGKNVATRIITEAAVVGGAQLAQDYLFVQPMREALGEPDVNYTEDFLQAAAFGALARGAFEGAAPGFRKLREKFGTADAYAHALEQDVANWNGVDARLFDMAPDVPSTRAAKAIWENDVALREANPYGNTDEGVAKFLRELDEVDQAFSTDSFVPEASAREPADIRAMVQERERLKVEAPEVHAKLVDAEAKLDELTGQAQDLENFIDKRTVGDIAASLTDEATGARIKQLEQMLDDPELPEPQKRSAEFEADKIIREIGADRIIKAGEDQAIKPKYQLRETRKAAKAARQEFNRAAREAYAEMDRMAARDLADQAFQRKSAEDSVLAALEMSQITPDPDTHMLSATSAAEAVRSVDSAVEAIPEQADALVKTGKQLTESDATKLKPELPGTFYHGSTLSDLTEILGGQFDRPGSGKNAGIYFSPTKEKARPYTLHDDMKTRGKIYETKLRAENPLYVDKANDSALLTPERIEQLKAEGYDAIINRENGEVVVFDKSQISFNDAVEELFDLGNGDKVSLDFRIELGDGTSATVREILTDLGDEDAMVEAMKVCAI